MTEDALVRCSYCRCPLNPNSRNVYRRVRGWERMAGRRASGKHGGSDISLREPLDEYACPSCVDRLRAGLAPAQESLL